jgi:hypothetical protein
MDPYQQCFGSGSRRAKITDKNRKKFRYIMFCMFPLRAEGSSCEGAELNLTPLSCVQLKELNWIWPPCLVFSWRSWTESESLVLRSVEGAELNLTPQVMCSVEGPELNLALWCSVEGAEPEGGEQRGAVQRDHRLPGHHQMQVSLPDDQ